MHHPAWIERLDAEQSFCGRLADEYDAAAAQR
jgi:hypothetical protein